MRFPDGAFDADDRVDTAIAESFPASDAPSWTGGLETKPEWRIAGIAAATDLSDCSRNALDHAIALVLATGAQLTVVHARGHAPDYDDLYRSGVPEPASGPPRYSDLYADARDPNPAPAMDEEAASALARTHRRQLDALPRVRQVTVAGEPVETILDAARRAGADLIALGSHSRHALAGALLGSTADAVIRQSGLPVLAVPCAAPRREGGAVVAILDEPDVAAEIHRRAAAVAALLQAELVTLRVPNDGRVDRRAELAAARIAVIAFPRDETRRVSPTDPNVRVLLRSGLCPVLTIPVN